MKNREQELKPFPLTGEDGNIFMILARLQTYYKRNKLDMEEYKKIHTEVTQSKSYDVALNIIQSYVKVC